MPRKSTEVLSGHFLVQWSTSERRNPSRSAGAVNYTSVYFCRPLPKSTLIYILPKADRRYFASLHRDSIDARASASKQPATDSDANKKGVFQNNFNFIPYVHSHMYNSSIPSLLPIIIRTQHKWWKSTCRYQNKTRTKRRQTYVVNQPCDVSANFVHAQVRPCKQYHEQYTEMVDLHSHFRSILTSLLLHARFSGRAGHLAHRARKHEQAWHKEQELSQCMLTIPRDHLHFQWSDLSTYISTLIYRCEEKSSSLFLHSDCAVVRLLTTGNITRHFE